MSDEFELSVNPHRQKYDIAYIETVFGIWVASGRPVTDRLMTMIPPDPNLGSIPDGKTVQSWRIKYGWAERAANIDATVQENTDRYLIQVRMDMLKRHADIAAEVTTKAYEHLLEQGFDSSSSAVQALFKGIESEKSSRGLAGALAKVFALSDDDLKKEMDKALLKLSDVGTMEEEAIDGEVDNYGNEEPEEADSGRAEEADPNDWGDAE